MRALEAAGIKVVPTGLKHGTVTAIANSRVFELTTLRRDVETDGRRAVVAFTDDWLEDAGRRDFTFNALYADPDGTLYDPFDGRADLAAGRVRFIGDPDTRIAEDRLRVLRFFRFHAWYGRPPLDGPSYQACARNAAALGGLSGERVRKELLRTLEAAAAPDALEAMREAGVLDRWLPEYVGAGAAACPDRARGRARRAAPSGGDPADGRRCHGHRQAAEAFHAGSHAARRHAGARARDRHRGRPARLAGGHLSAGQRPLHRSPAAGDRRAGRLAGRTGDGPQLDAARAAGERRRCAEARPQARAEGRAR